MRVDRDSPVPYYYQLKRVIAEEISGGTWAPGDRIPSEPELCGRFGVSRTTVRQALTELESEGVLRSDKGRGRFVTAPRSRSRFLQSSAGFYDEAVRAGETVSSRVLRREVGPLPGWAAELLELSPGARGVSLERLRFVNGEPVMYAASHLVEELAGAVLGVDLETGSLYRALRKEEGLAVAGGRRVVEAVGAPDAVARLLGVEEGGPLLYVEAVSWDAGARPFECYRAWHRSDRAQIEVQVVDEAAAASAGFRPTSARFEE